MSWNSIPITWCVVQYQTISDGSISRRAYKIIDTVKCDLRDVDHLNAEYKEVINTNPGFDTMIFVREPDNNPVTGTV